MKDYKGASSTKLIKGTLMAKRWEYLENKADKNLSRRACETSLLFLNNKIVHKIASMVKNNTTKAGHICVNMSQPFPNKNNKEFKNNKKNTRPRNSKTS